MVSQAQLAWEERMSSYGYVPARYKVSNFFSGLGKVIAFPFKLGKSVIKGTYNVGKNLVKGTWVVGRDLYDTGKAINRGLKIVYKDVSPHVETLAKEIKAYRIEQAGIKNQAKVSEKAKSRLEMMMEQVQNEADRGSRVVFSDYGDSKRTYGRAYEASSQRLETTADGKTRYVPTGILVDISNKKVLRY